MIKSGVSCCKHDIGLQRRRSWGINTDPSFGPKAADIVGLYLNPQENALVLCVDEKPSIQAWERAPGWLRLPNGKALNGFRPGYKRHGPTVGHYYRRRLREFPDCMNPIVAAYPDRELHVVLDNLSTHKPIEDRWLKGHRKVHLHFTPTYSSWLNQVQGWFNILGPQGLPGVSLLRPCHYARTLKALVYPTAPKPKYAYLYN
jgi:hypothetical protein